MFIHLLLRLLLRHAQRFAVDMHILSDSCAAGKCGKPRPKPTKKKPTKKRPTRKRPTKKKLPAACGGEWRRSKQMQAPTPIARSGGSSGLLDTGWSQHACTAAGKCGKKRTVKKG
jgi:hypothetical protein